MRKNHERWDSILTLVWLVMMYAVILFVIAGAQWIIFGRALEPALAWGAVPAFIVWVVILEMGTHDDE